jgi:dTDP-4-amino-4,6-dideoxygalactose transaminase
MIKNRDAIRLELKNSGVYTEIHYPNVAGIEAGGGTSSDFIVSSRIAMETLSLPISPWQTSKHTDYVIQSLHNSIN